MSRAVSSSTPASRPRLDKYGYNCIARQVSMVFLVCGPLFIGAGTLNWDWAWIYTSITLIGWIALNLVLVRANPELLNERGKRVKSLVGTKQWDWLILAIYFVLLMVTPLVAGLDYRYAWSPPVSDSVRLMGVTVLIISFLPLTWSMAVNRFFVASVRIQTNRQHQVIASGPYRYVRHPGYVGVILQFLAVPLALGTLVAAIPALLGVAIYILRTWLEDRTLSAELPGYAEFARQTRYRLIPGLW